MSPHPETRPIVELQSVCKTFDSGRILAVDSVSLTVQPGETLALLGPSGCGKTTTLRLINRLDDPDSGQVLVRGSPVRHQRPEQLRRSIGYVIQEGGLFPHLSVAANVSTVPRLLGWPSSRIAKRVEEVLDMVGLPAGEFAQRKPDELSGGQRQRVGVARALAADPSLLLMDEPFSALDPITREVLHEEFLLLEEQLQKTVVLVTHDMVEAGRLAERVALMDRGRIVQHGPIRELLFHPCDPFVSDFFEAHRQQMIFETLQLDDILDDLQPAPSSEKAPQVELSGCARLRDAVQPIVQARENATLALSDGRHRERIFLAADVRKRLFGEIAL